MVDKFSMFLDDMGECPENNQIDRIDSDGNYCPENCRWVTSTENNNNRSNTLFIEMNGKRLADSEWAKIYGIKRKTIVGRIKLGWSVSDAITKQLHPSRWALP